MHHLSKEMWKGCAHKVIGAIPFFFPPLPPLPVVLLIFLSS